MSELKFVKCDVVVKQPRIKADSTGTLNLGTTEEIVKKYYDYLNDLAFSAEVVEVVIVRKEEYVDFIINEANALTANNPIQNSQNSEIINENV